MSTAKEEVEALLSKSPDDCSIEDIQYHLISQVENGIVTVAAIVHGRRLLDLE